MAENHRPHDLRFNQGTDAYTMEAIATLVFGRHHIGYLPTHYAATWVAEGARGRSGHGNWPTTRNSIALPARDTNWIELILFLRLLFEAQKQPRGTGRIRPGTAWAIALVPALAVSSRCSGGDGIAATLRSSWRSNLFREQISIHGHPNWDSYTAGGCAGFAAQPCRRARLGRARATSSAPCWPASTRCSGLV